MMISTVAWKSQGVTNNLRSRSTVQYRLNCLTKGGAQDQQWEGSCKSYKTTEGSVPCTGLAAPAIRGSDSRTLVGQRSPKSTRADRAWDRGLVKDRAQQGLSYDRATQTKRD